tara:strand:- start:15072 stop:15479 length:408 start_codon:yes stop_codon:yes gene_type:complete
MEFRFKKSLRIIFVVISILISLTIVLLPVGIGVLYLILGARLTLDSSELRWKKFGTRTIKYSEVTRAYLGSWNYITDQISREGGASGALIRAGNTVPLILETSKKKYKIPVNNLENSAEIVKFLKKKLGNRFRIK